MEQLSSGKRINTASDDAAGMAIASRITSEVKGIEMAIRNSSDAQALIDTAEGAHQEVENILQRARELAVQASNDTNSSDDRASLQLEINQLLTEVDRISANTSWAGKSLMGGPKGGSSDFSFQIGTGNAAADTVKVSIGETSAVALGIGGSPSGVTGRDTGPAGMRIEGNKIIIEGTPAQGDTFKFDINDVEVDIIYSASDQYTDDVRGVAAQLKDDIDALVAGGTISAMTVTDNNDGTLTINQSTTPDIDTSTTIAEATANGGDSATVDGNIVTLAGDWDEATDAVTITINGIDAQYLKAANDGFENGYVGAAAGLKQAVENQAGLENIIVTDNGDGSLTFTQSSAPVLEAAKVGLTTDPAVAVAFTSSAAATGALAVTGSFVAGQQISFELFGETISFTTKDEDGFQNTLAGISNQMAAAINNAGISGVTAAKGSGTNTVDITADTVAANAEVVSGDATITTSTGSIDNGTGATVVITESGTPAAGDAYSFEVAGQSFSFVVAEDGYTDDVFGLAEQMKDTVDAAGIEGLSVVASASTGASATITITRPLNGVTSGSGASTVVTNVQSLAPDEIAVTEYSGAIDVSTADLSANAINRIDAALLQLNAQRAELGAVSNRMDYTINNLSNVSSNLQGGLSRIQDADFAKVTGDLTKSQIMSQAATAMLAQANASKQGVLSLLQG